MIARALRWLMLLQVLAVLGLAWLLCRPVCGLAALALLLGVLGVLLLRALIVARNFWHSRRFAGAAPRRSGWAWRRRRACSWANWAPTCAPRHGACCARA